MNKLLNNKEGGQKTHGFTIVELLVSMTLFVVVITIVSAFFIRSIRSQRLVVRLMSVNDGVSLVLEQMAREIRTGYNFCPSGCELGELEFTNASGSSVFYGSDGIFIIRISSNDGLLEPITSDDVIISRLQFLVSGEGSGDGLQPRITVSLEAQSVEELLNSVAGKTYIQTTVSSRVPDS